MLADQTPPETLTWGSFSMNQRDFQANCSRSPLMCVAGHWPPQSDHTKRVSSRRFSTSKVAKSRKENLQVSKKLAKSLETGLPGNTHKKRPNFWNMAQIQPKFIVTINKCKKKLPGKHF
jgi:hypothetical protein